MNLRNCSDVTAWTLMTRQADSTPISPRAGVDGGRSLAPAIATARVARNGRGWPHNTHTKPLQAFSV